MLHYDFTKKKSSEINNFYLYVDLLFYLSNTGLENHHHHHPKKIGTTVFAVSLIFRGIGHLILRTQRWSPAHSAYTNLAESNRARALGLIRIHHPKLEKLRPQKQIQHLILLAQSATQTDR